MGSKTYQAHSLHVFLTFVNLKCQQMGMTMHLKPNNLLIKKLNEKSVFFFLMQISVSANLFAKKNENSPVNEKNQRNNWNGITLCKIY